MERAVFREEVNEQGGTAALVAVREWVVFDHEVQQIGCLLLHRRVELFAREPLVDRRDDALERVAAFEPSCSSRRSLIAAPSIM